jgi:hypothetical protein
LILLDTNILLRYALATDPNYGTVDTAVNALHQNGEVLSVVPQNLYEFWATATRPITANGLGLTVSECQVQIGRIKRLFRMLPDLPTLLGEWERLVRPRVSRPRVLRCPTRRRDANARVDSATDLQRRRFCALCRGRGSRPG